MKNAKFSNNLIKLSLFMIIVTSLFATISCENNGVGSSSSAESNSKLPDISDVGRSISLSGSNNDLVIKWYPPKFTNSDIAADNTQLTAADVSYELYYIKQASGTPKTTAKAIIDAGAQKLTTVSSTDFGGITLGSNPDYIATATIKAKKSDNTTVNLAAGETYEIAIIVVNGTKRSVGVRFEVKYLATTKPTHATTPPSGVRFFTAVGKSNAITITFTEQPSATNEYWIYPKTKPDSGSLDIASVIAGTQRIKTVSSDYSKNTKDITVTPGTYLIVVRQVIIKNNTYTSITSGIVEATATN